MIKRENKKENIEKINIKTLDQEEEIEYKGIKINIQKPPEW